MLSLAFTLALGTLCCAAPADLGLKLDKRAGTMPTLTLPYATYQASSYNPNGDVSTTHKARSSIADIDCNRYIPSRTSVSLHHLSETFDGRNQLLQKRRRESKMALMAQFVFKHPSKDLNYQAQDLAALAYFFHRSLVKVKVGLFRRCLARANFGLRLSLSRYLRPCSGRQKSDIEITSHLLVLWRRVHLRRKGFFRKCAALLRWNRPDPRIRG